jgi:RNA polymerase sigma factor (sigma-70 family)
VNDIHATISIASDSRSSLAARHDAFSELVIRFQDMAFACAYAVLGDSYLAEDVAQEAFVVAWQKLDQLREAKAFPGWFKRIVLSQCNRLTRGKRLQIVPLDDGLKRVAVQPGPQLIAEKHELLASVLRAIKELPESERLVTTLFYVSGYSQADIGQFLEVPVSTVNKRLYNARRRLKESVEVFKDNLKNQRPSRDRSFSDRVNASLRPLSNRDWVPVKAIAFARTQPDVSGNELWLQRRQNFDEKRYERRQYVAEHAESRQILAFGSIEQTNYLPRYRLFLVSDPRWLKAGVGELLLQRLLSDLVEVNAVSVSCREYTTQTEVIEFLNENGFAETVRVMDLRLEVANVDTSSLLQIESGLKASGINITSLAEERKRDEKCAEKLHQLASSLYEDDAGRAPFSPPAYNEREARLWLDMPYLLPQAYFIAKHGTEYVGVSDVSLYEASPRGLMQGFTGVRTEYRRRGIATALMMREIEYAKKQDYKLIQSFNRPTPSGALTLIEKLGFRVMASRVTLEKCLKNVIEVNSMIYDEYAGRYRDDVRRPDLEMIVRNEAGRLTIEAVGQKVELFPTSPNEFFVKQFYGAATFVRDDLGRVDLLKFVMPEYKTRQASMQLAKRIGDQ